MGQPVIYRPYPLRPHGEHEYVFTTELGNTYTIGFLRYWQEDVLPLYIGIDVSIYEIYFEVIEIQQKGADRRIQHTMMDTIIEFISVENRIAFFYIQREDGRGRELLRVYNAWLRAYEKQEGEAGIMSNRVIKLPTGSDKYVACVIHRDNELLGHDNADEMIDRAIMEIFPKAELEEF